MIQIGTKVKFTGNGKSNINKETIYKVETTINKTVHTQLKTFYVCREHPEIRDVIIAEENELKII